MELIERVKKIGELAKVPMTEHEETRRVEIIMLKFKEEPKIIDEAIHKIVHRTQHPFKLAVFDNRLNSANTSRIWNKLVSEATCPYICLIDSDAFVPELKPCWLSRMMESIDETGVVVPVVDNAGGVNKAAIQKKYPTATKTHGVWAGMCFLFKKELWRKEKFSEQYYIYGQDSEWALRIGVKHGGTIVREDVLVRHIGSYSWDKENEKGAVDKEADKVYAKHLFERDKKRLLGE